MSEYSINTISTFALFLVIWYKSRKSFISHIFSFTHTEYIIFRMKYDRILYYSLIVSFTANPVNTLPIINLFHPHHQQLHINNTSTTTKQYNNRRILSSFSVVPELPAAATIQRRFPIKKAAGYKLTCCE